MTFPSTPRLRKPLSPQETRLVQAVRDGANTTADIARALKISAATVRVYLRNMAPKFDVADGPRGQWLVIITRYALDTRATRQGQAPGADRR